MAFSESLQYVTQGRVGLLRALTTHLECKAAACVAASICASPLLDIGVVLIRCETNDLLPLAIYEGQYFLRYLGLIVEKDQTSNYAPVAEEYLDS